MLSMAPALFRQCSCRAEVTAATVTKPAIRDPFTIPGHLTKLERWPLPGGLIYEGVANCAMSHFSTLGASARPGNFDFSLKEYIMKTNSSYAENASAQVSSWPACPFKRYRRKACTLKAETDSSSTLIASRGDRSLC